MIPLAFHRHGSLFNALQICGSEIGCMDSVRVLPGKRIQHMSIPAMDRRGGPHSPLVVREGIGQSRHQYGGYVYNQTRSAKVSFGLQTSGQILFSVLSFWQICVAAHL